MMERDGLMEEGDDKQSNKDVATYQVGGMTCGACVETIERMLRQQEGIYTVTVALLAERAVVEFDSTRWTAEKIAEEIEDVGFEASVIAEVREDVQVLKVFGMTCASCTSAVEQGVGSMNGVLSCAVSLATEEAKVEYDRSKVGIRDIVDAIEDLGFDAILSDDSDSTQLQSLSRTKEIQEWWSAFLISFSFALPVFVISMVLPRWSFTRSIILWQPIRNLYLDDILCLALTIPVQFGIGKRFYLTSFRALRHYTATMDVLIMLGTSASFTYSFFAMLFALFCSGEMCMKPATFFETSTMLITFVTFGRYLENAAKGRTSEALSKLISLTPSMATIYTDGKAMLREKKVASELIQTGDYVKVIPGEKIAADGVVIRGKSTVDESMVTGEPRPVNKDEGSMVIGGTVNCLGTFDFLVTRAGKEASLGQIVRLVSEAQTSKAPIQAFADRVAGIFVPCVVLLGALTFVFWMCLSHLLQVQTLPDVFKQEGATPLMVCLKLCISVIVVACPCALGLSTPTAVMVGTGVGAQNGILIKGGGPLEASSTISHIMFDKTGTLTRGKLTVSNLCWNDGREGHVTAEEGAGDTPTTTTVQIDPQTLRESCVGDLSKGQILDIVAAAESKSEHPLARATSAYIETAIGRGSNVSISSFESVTGRGVQCRATVTTGSTSHGVLIGSLDFVKSKGCKVDAEVESFSAKEAAEGKTTIFAAVDGSFACAISLADQLKPEAKRCIQALTRMGIKCAIMTGDSEATARAIARQLDISDQDVFAGMSPNGKRSVIVDLKAELEATKGRRRSGICFVGDGINDSPALAAATLGIAVGGGTEIAMEAASIVLMREDLMDVPASLHLSRRIFRQIKLNYIWATGYNFVFVPLAMGVGLPWGVHLQPMMAGAAMAFSSVSVVLSSLTLKWWKRPEWLMSKEDISVASLHEPMQPMQMTSTAATSNEYMERLQQLLYQVWQTFTGSRIAGGGTASASARQGYLSHHPSNSTSAYESVPIEMA